MMRGNGIDEHRRFIRARASTISSHCPICIIKNTDKITTVRPIAELHHIFGRSTHDPTHLKESIFGTIPLCHSHHEQFPPLSSVEEYHRRAEHWDILLDGYWRYIGSFNFLSDKERILRDGFFNLSTEEFIEYFTGD